MFALQAQSLLLTVITLVLLAVKAWAFVDAVSHRPDAFVAADKQTKPMWLIILGVTLAAHIISSNNPLGFLSLIGAVAAIVYLVDARPALRSLTRR